MSSLKMPDKRNSNVMKNASTRTIASTYHGPLPLSSELRNYENVCPGAAGRIISMAEFSQKSVSEKQNKALDNDKLKIEYSCKLANKSMNITLCLCLFYCL